MMKRTSKKPALTKTIKEYASRSTIHGIAYVFDRDLNMVDHLLMLCYYENTMKDFCLFQDSRPELSLDIRKD